MLNPILANMFMPVMLDSILPGDVSSFTMMSVVRRYSGVTTSWNNTPVRVMAMVLTANHRQWLMHIWRKLF